MATYTRNMASPNGFTWYEALLLSPGTVLQSATSSLYVLELIDGTIVRITGVGFTYDSLGRPTSGLIQSLSYRTSTGAVIESYTGLSGVSLPQFFGTPITTLLNTLMQGADTVNGYSGDDFLLGGPGGDVLNGGDGFDAADYFTATAAVTANLANPALNTGHAAGDSYNSIEDIWGSRFADSLTGDANENMLAGDEGNDTLDGGAGADFLIGGLDNDTYVIDDYGDVALESPDGGTDTIRTGLAYYALVDGDNIENLTFTGTSELNVGFGSGINNVLTGTSGSDSLTGNGGSDTFVAGGGDDYLYIDHFDAAIDAGEGYDAIFIQDTANTTLNVGASGAEWVYAWIGNDTLDASGSAAGVTLVGEAGSDTLTGSAHDDYIYMDAFDAVNAGDGYDALFVFQGSGQDAIDTTIDASAANAEWVLGGAGNDTITNLGDDTSVALSGGGGNDVITGGLGNDYLFGNEGADIFVVTSNAQFDAILDFEAGVDKVDLTAIPGIADFDALLAGASESEGSVLLDLGGGNQLMLYEVPLASLSAGDFIFA